MKSLPNRFILALTRAQFLWLSEIASFFLAIVSLLFLFMKMASMLSLFSGEHQLDWVGTYLPFMFHIVFDMLVSFACMVHLVAASVRLFFFDWFEEIFRYVDASTKEWAHANHFEDDDKLEIAISLVMKFDRFRQSPFFKGKSGSVLNLFIASAYCVTAVTMIIVIRL